MTLVYDPPRDPSAGAEYCRVNVDVSLGTYDPGPDGRPTHEKKIPLQPTDYKELFEWYQVKHGFKWSPVKVYRRALQRTSGSRWRLEMRLLCRDELQPPEPQSVALVVTMFDPRRELGLTEEPAPPPASGDGDEEDDADVTEDTANAHTAN